MTIHPFSRYVEHVDFAATDRWRVKVCIDWPGVETRALLEGIVVGTRQQADQKLNEMIRDLIAELHTLLPEGQKEGDA
jgi:hypothetical protein